jgi:hypothetical protein
VNGGRSFESDELRHTPGVIQGLFKGREDDRSESATTAARGETQGSTTSLPWRKFLAGEEGAADTW